MFSFKGVFAASPFVLVMALPAGQQNDLDNITGAYSFFFGLLIEV